MLLAAATGAQVRASSWVQASSPPSYRATLVDALFLSGSDQLGVTASLAERGLRHSDAGPARGVPCDYRISTQDANMERPPHMCLIHHQGWPGTRRACAAGLGVRGTCTTTSDDSPGDDLERDQVHPVSVRDLIRKDLLGPGHRERPGQGCSPQCSAAKKPCSGRRCCLR